MKIQVSWDNKDQDVLRFAFPKSWNAHDLAHSIKRAIKMMYAVPHRVDVIFETPGRAIASDALEILRAAILRYPDKNLTVVVDTDPTVKAAVRWFRRVNEPLRDQICVASTLKDARAAIHYARQVAQT